MSHASAKEREPKVVTSGAGKLGFWLSVVAVYATLIAAVAAAVMFRTTASLGLAFFSFLAIGWLQYVIMQAMHESCHQAHKGLEKWAAVFCLFFPIGLTWAYRKIHFAHHRSFNTEADPDRFAYINFPKSKTEFLGILFTHASGWAAARQFLKQNSGDTGQQHTGESRDKVFLLLIQLIIFTVFTLLASPLDYFLFWIGPLVTVGKVLGYLRLLAEHGDPKKGPVLRTFRCAAIPGAILGPYGFARHAEHHADMKTPFSKLKHLSQKSDVPGLDAYADKHASWVEVFQGSHLTILARWWLTLPTRSFAD